MARRAHSLQTLLNQVNATWPNRNKASDGWIADSNHASTSDHQPNAQGIVRAQDITHDPSSGMDAQKLADALISSGDSRIKYIIFNRRIWEGSWKPYNGDSAHTKHIHISVKGDYDNPKQWKIKEEEMLPPINEGDLVNVYRKAIGREPNANDIAYWTKGSRSNDWKGFVYDLISRADFVGNLPQPNPSEAEKKLSEIRKLIGG